MRDRTLWTAHLGAGGLILVFLGLHMAIMHLGLTGDGLGVPGDKAIDWASVALRAQSVFFAVTYVVLVGATLYHGLYGLRNILLELNPGPALRKVIDVGLSVVGLALFAFGTWAALAAPGAATTVGG